jgi:integrase
MAARGLTDIGIKHLRAGAVRREIPDKLGLYYIIEPSGFRSFASRTRIGGKPVKISHGNVPLSVARKQHAHVLHEIREGRDPRIAKQTARAQRRAIEADSLESIVEKYFTLVCGMKRNDGGKVTFNDNHRTARRRLRDLERLVLKDLGSKPITLIKRSEIVAVLDKIQLGSGGVQADRVLGVLRSVLNWHASRSDDFKTPLVRGMARTKVVKRQRILDDNELRKIWNSNVEGAFPMLVRFLLLSGARRNEAARMTWDEVKDGIWQLPLTRNKTKQALSRPLSAAALAVLESQRRDDGCRFVFTAKNGKTPLSDFGRCKARYDRQTGVSNYVLHDLRRTARSLMSRAGVDSDHAERCLGHLPGTIRQTYDQHSFIPEMRIAYQKLAVLIHHITSNVVTQLHRKKR